MIVYLQPNAKDMNGYLLPLCFFDGYVQLIEEYDKACLLKCDKHEIMVLKEYIRKNPSHNG